MALTTEAAGWVKYFAPNGQPYYYNLKTGETTWQSPTPPQKPKQKRQKPPPPPVPAKPAYLKAKGIIESIEYQQRQQLRLLQQENNDQKNNMALQQQEKSQQQEQQVHKEQYLQEGGGDNNRHNCSNRVVVVVQQEKEKGNQQTTTIIHKDNDMNQTSITPINDYSNKQVQGSKPASVENNKNKSTAVGISSDQQHKNKEDSSTLRESPTHKMMMVKKPPFLSTLARGLAFKKRDHQASSDGSIYKCIGGEDDNNKEKDNSSSSHHKPHQNLSKNDDSGDCSVKGGSSNCNVASKFDWPKLPLSLLEGIRTGKQLRQSKVQPNVVQGGYSNGNYEPAAAASAENADNDNILSSSTYRENHIEEGSSQNHVATSSAKHIPHPPVSPPHPHTDTFASRPKRVVKPVGHNDDEIPIENKTRNDLESAKCAKPLPPPPSFIKVDHVDKAVVCHESQQSTGIVSVDQTEGLSTKKIMCQPSDLLADIRSARSVRSEKQQVNGVRDASYCPKQQASLAAATPPPAKALFTSSSQKQPPDLMAAIRQHRASSSGGGIHQLQKHDKQQPPPKKEKQEWCAQKNCHHDDGDKIKQQESCVSGKTQHLDDIALSSESEGKKGIKTVAQQQPQDLLAAIRCGAKQLQPVKSLLLMKSDVISSDLEQLGYTRKQADSGQRNVSERGGGQRFAGNHPLQTFRGSRGNENYGDSSTKTADPKYDNNVTSTLQEETEEGNGNVRLSVRYDWKTRSYQVDHINRSSSTPTKSQQGNQEEDTSKTTSDIFQQSTKSNNEKEQQSSVDLQLLAGSSGDCNKREDKKSPRGTSANNHDAMAENPQEEEMDSNGNHSMEKNTDATDDSVTQSEPWPHTSQAAVEKQQHHFSPSSSPKRKVLQSSIEVLLPHSPMCQPVPAGLPPSPPTPPKPPVLDPSSGSGVVFSLSSIAPQALRLVFPPLQPLRRVHDASVVPPPPPPPPPPLPQRPLEEPTKVHNEKISCGNTGGEKVIKNQCSDEDNHNVSSLMLEEGRGGGGYMSCNVKGQEKDGEKQESFIGDTVVTENSLVSSSQYHDNNEYYSACSGSAKEGHTIDGPMTLVPVDLILHIRSLEQKINCIMDALGIQEEQSS